MQPHFFLIPVRYNKHKDIVLGIHLCGKGDCSVGKNASMELDKQTQFLGPDSHAGRGEPTSVNCLLTSYVSRNIHFHTDACMHKMKFKMLSEYTDFCTFQRRLPSSNFLSSLPFFLFVSSLVESRIFYLYDLDLLLSSCHLRAIIYSWKLNWKLHSILKKHHFSIPISFL